MHEATFIRKPAVAGMFYEANPAALVKQIEAAFLHPLGPGALPEMRQEPAHNLMALIVPHAGYVYSGPVAAHAYAALAQDGKPDVIVILGPNHRGWGAPLAVTNHSAWHTPLGDIPIDEALVRALVDQQLGIARDSLAHQTEHSIEVQIPFLQYLYGNTVPFVPLSMARMSIWESHLVADALVSALAGRRALIIASTDLNHYAPQDLTLRLDNLALAPILHRDPEELARVIDANDITMCGSGPTIATLMVANRLAATHITLLKHATSGDACGDLSRVVGYAALRIAVT